MSAPNPAEERAVALENFWDNITPEQEEKLRMAHGEHYMGTDDDMPDAFEAWAERLTLEDLEEIL